MTNDWKPTASREAMQHRAELYRVIRQFMAERNILEVQTSIFSQRATTDPNLDSFESCYFSPKQTNKEHLFLNTSPEFAMKRLLAAGFGPIYQISTVFRNKEESRIHHPEFTLLEWYRPEFNSEKLMIEISSLLKLFNFNSIKKFSYSQLFSDIVGQDPHRITTIELSNLARQFGLENQSLAHNDYLDFIFSERVLPQLGKEACFIYDFPASQAALARIEGGVAKRFELIIKGIEIANGFYELNDALEQEQRFKNENNYRKANGMKTLPIDERLLDALRSLPDCAGVAIGIERLLMVLHGYTDITQVIPFPISRC